MLGFGSAAEAWLTTQNFSYSVLVYAYLRDEGFSQEAKDVVLALLNFPEEKNFDEASGQAARAILSLLAAGQLAGPYTEAEREAVIQEHFFNPDQYIQFVTHCIILRTEWENNHPGQTCATLCQTGIALEA